MRKHNEKNEDYIMSKQIGIVRDAISKLFEGCDNVPMVEYRWNGGSIDVILSDGKYTLRDLIENHFTNGNRYKSVTVYNQVTRVGDYKKKISFYLE